GAGGLASADSGSLRDTLAPSVARFRCYEPAPARMHALSLHDALPISGGPPGRRQPAARTRRPTRGRSGADRRPAARRTHDREVRSEEHTSELQSRENLVCRLLLEKKKADVVDSWPLSSSWVRLNFSSL